jgi:ABC-type branched-subunit amino acid transport system substrate-binding protein
MAGAQGGSMRLSGKLARRVSTIVVLCTVVVLIASTLAGASAPKGEMPKADDIGITDKEIRLAVVADVENQLVPGLFQPAVDGMRAWAKLVNKNGGLAGRKVVIDFIDSHLSPDDARSAVIKACAEDFAMVGGEALFLNNVDDMVTCPDKQGNPIGLPDLPGLALEPAQRCSPVTFVATGDKLFCATRDQNPQTYYPNDGDFRYFLEQNDDLHGIFAVPSDLKATRDAVLPQVEAAVELGIKKDGEGFYNTSARNPQSAVTPLVQVVKDSESNFVYNGNSFTVMVHLRKEAKLQGADSVEFWACNQGCYDKLFIEQGGDDVDGTYSVLYSLPFYTEYKSNPTLKSLVKSLGDVEEMNANGVAAWIAALLFEQAVEEAVADGGELTRQSLLDALGAIHDFDADGIIGKTDIANRDTSPCFVMTQVKNGRLVRVYPKKVGSFDCKSENVAEIPLNLNEG